MTAIGNHIVVLNSIDSSNNYAMQQVHAGLAEHGYAWFALEQTAGKGQRGKEWKGTKAENIAVSVVLETSKLGIGQQFRLSAAVAVGVLNFFSEYAGAGCSIKWPNDLYWGDRKAGGILIENVIGLPSTVDRPQSTYDRALLAGGMQEQPADLLMHLNQQQPTVDVGRLTVGSVWKWAVAGIGININQTRFPDHLPNPISLHHITGKKYEMMELVSKLCTCLEVQWQLLMQGNWDTILDNYNRHLYKKGAAVRLRKNNVVMPCTIRGVSEAGKLLIAEDETVAFDFGEVSWEL